MYNIDKKVFDENLLITQTYCEMQLTNTDKPVAEILRSFNPEYNGKRLVIYRSSLKVPVEWSIDPFDKENKYLFKDLFENQLSHKIKEIKELAINKQINGAVLVVEVYNSQMDGGATAYSEGLFDLYDWPPKKSHPLQAAFQSKYINKIILSQCHKAYVPVGCASFGLHLLSAHSNGSFRQARLLQNVLLLRRLNLRQICSGKLFCSG
jgi:light-regulated signal transduction histidine kinase (bacteriophytochrome)